MVSPILETCRCAISLPVDMSALPRHHGLLLRRGLRGISAVHSEPAVSATQARFQLSCSLCSQSYGACIQCAGSRQCFAAFHPTCASKEGLRMVCLSATAARLLPEAPAQEIQFQHNLSTKIICSSALAHPRYQCLSRALC